MALPVRVTRRHHLAGGRQQIEYPISDLCSVSYTATPSSRILVEARCRRPA